VVCHTVDKMIALIVTSMNAPVKRNYASTLRSEQARNTRRAIVNAAALLFVERGYGATTIDAIAEGAGVSRKTVFSSVGGKAEALKLALDWAIAGDDEPVALMDRAEVRSQRQERDARVLLRRYAVMERHIVARMVGLARVVESAAGSDPALRDLADQSARQRRAGMGALASVLAARGALPPSITVEEAADVLWLLNDPLTYHRLVFERDWSPDRYEQWLGDALVALLVREDYSVDG
jgi:AcrR family transcriptional regulator